jgi:alpha-tubulin suppressor-like RCC1 family protein
MLSQGNVYAWGLGEDGRLGLGSPDETELYEIGWDPNTDETYW